MKKNMNYGKSLILGASFGRIMLWVSDGQYYASTELKVRASPPFIEVVNNSGIFEIFDANCD